MDGRDKPGHDEVQNSDEKLPNVSQRLGRDVPSHNGR
jgi:hypothetical protein